MSRPKQKNWRVITLSISDEALAVLDKIRGNIPRTTYIERLILNTDKQKADLITENYELKKRVKELQEKIKEDWKR